MTVFPVHSQTHWFIQYSMSTGYCSRNYCFKKSAPMVILCEKISQIFKSAILQVSPAKYCTLYSEMNFCRGVSNKKTELQLCSIGLSRRL